MENNIQKARLTRSNPAELVSEDSEPERALRAYGTSFPTTMYRDATTISRHASSAAGLADPNAWANTLDKVVQDDKHAGNRERLSHTMPTRADSPIIGISKEKLRSWNQVDGE